MRKFDKGLMSSIGMSIVLLILFYGPVMPEMGKTYFGVGGDGLLTYYNTLYHVQHDTTLMHQGSMNYPYGENSFFTNNFLLVSGIMQPFHQYIDPSILVWIFNFFILASFVLAAIFLYKIFRKLNLPETLSAIIAVGLTFLSPQIPRIVGHFYLTYIFALPLTLYLLMLFHERRNIKTSLFLGLSIFLLSVFQFYYFALLGSVVLSFWCFSLLTDPDYRKYNWMALQLSIQLVLPFIFLSTWTGFTDTVTDRTNNPWGYFFYVSSIESVFLPLAKPHAYLIGKFHLPYAEWEGFAFIGINGIIISITLFLVGLKNTFSGKIKSVINITDNHVLNAFFWTGILTLLFSFGYPFKGPLENILDYLNIVKQIRSLGRFAWIFFYTMNIVAFYKIYQWINHKEKMKQILAWTFVIIFLSYDAFTLNRGLVKTINNKLPHLEDKQNQSAYNKWVNNINTKKYQAILPLPYFHNGSENIWYGVNSSITYHSYIASLKTGLPITAVHLSRTSISQTYKNLAMVLEPYRPLEILKDYPNKKPLLIISKDRELNANEQNLVSKAHFLIKNEEFSLYELPFHILENISSGLGKKIIKELDTITIFKHGEFYSTQPEKKFIYVNFDSLSSNILYRGSGAFKGKINERNLIYEGRVPDFFPELFTVSFWIHDIRKDMLARTIFNIEFITNGKVYYTDINPIFPFIKTIDNGWALFQTEFLSKDPNLKIRIYLSNKIPGNPDIYIDELLIKPAKSDIYKKIGNEIYKNNKFYSLE